MNESKIMRGVNLFLESLSESDFERISAANKFSSDYDRAQRAYDNRQPNYEDERPTHYVDTNEMAESHEGWAEDHDRLAKESREEGDEDGAKKHEAAALHHRRAAITYKSYHHSDLEHSDYHHISGKAVEASFHAGHQFDRNSKNPKEDTEAMMKEFTHEHPKHDGDYDFDRYDDRYSYHESLSVKEIVFKKLDELYGEEPD